MSQSGSRLRPNRRALTDHSRATARHPQRRGDLRDAVGARPTPYAQEHDVGRSQVRSLRAQGEYSLLSSWVRSFTGAALRIKFADLSEYGYGVAILSESKYGFSCQGNVLRISLLRAATAPDAGQDQGECLLATFYFLLAGSHRLCFPGKHEFSWAVLPHRGHFLQSSVPIAAYLFNSPLHGVSTHFHQTTDPF